MKTTEYENGVLICTKHRTPISKNSNGFFCVKCQRNATAPPHIVNPETGEILSYNQ